MNQVARNLSLAPATPVHEPLLAYSLAGDQENSRQKTRRKRRRTNKWQNQNRFPSPSVFRTTLGILREMPCARMHYNSFKRMFPNMPTRTEKERRFRLEAAQLMPFAKYPNEQVISMLQTESTTETSKSTIPNKNSIIHKTVGESQFGPYEKIGGDNLMSGGISPSATEHEPGSEATASTSDESDSDNERAEDVPLPNIRSTGTTQWEDFGSVVSEPPSTPPPVLAPGKPSPVVSEDFLSLSDTGPIELSKRSEMMGPNPITDREASVPYATPSSLGPNDPCQRADFTTALLYPVQHSEPERSDSVSQLTSDITSRHTCSETYDKSKTVRKAVPASLCRVARTRPHMGGVKCTACGQAAYPAERLEAEGLVFHVHCFRCHRCGTMLQRGAWNQHGSHHLCNPCHRRTALQTLRH